MNFEEFRRQLIWHFLGKYDNIFIYMHSYIFIFPCTYICMHAFCTSILSRHSVLSTQANALNQLSRNISYKRSPKNNISTRSKSLRSRTTRIVYLPYYKRSFCRAIDLHCQHNSPTTHIAQHIPEEASGFHQHLDSSSTNNGSAMQDHTQGDRRKPSQCPSIGSVSNLSHLYILVRPIFNL